MDQEDWVIVAMMACIGLFGALLIVVAAALRALGERC